LPVPGARLAGLATLTTPTTGSLRLLPLLPPAGRPPPPVAEIAVPVPAPPGPDDAPIVAAPAPGVEGDCAARAWGTATPTTIARPCPRRALVTGARETLRRRTRPPRAASARIGRRTLSPGAGPGGWGTFPARTTATFPPPGADADANAADGGGRGPPGGTTGGDNRLFQSRATGTATARTSEVGGPTATAAAAAGGSGWCIRGALLPEGYRLLMGGCPPPLPGPGANAIGHAAYMMARMERMDKLWHMDGPDCGSLVVELAVAAAAVAALQRRLGAVMATVAAAWRQCGIGSGSSSAAVAAAEAVVAAVVVAVAAAAPQSYGGSLVAALAVAMGAAGGGGSSSFVAA
jgi:hypothetical protein